MSKKYKRSLSGKRQWKKLRRSFTGKFFVAGSVVGVIGILAVITFILGPMKDARRVHTTELLNVIAKVESRGNYNAYYGNASNDTIRFTSMSVEDVLAWQREFVSAGNPSSAIGRYQFIDSTLSGLVRQLGIDLRATFDEALQDRLAVALLERRGLHDYVDSKISRQEFAHNLSKEWAALPMAIGDNPQQSYYAGDGLNKAQLNVDEVYSGIETVRKL